MLRSQGSYILLNHARDYLRQHFAIDAGLDNIDHRPLGSAPSEVDAETRKECHERMAQVRERAHQELAGLISGAKVNVWRESDSGEMQLAAPGFAQDCFDGVDGMRADRLYFLVDDWARILAELASQESKSFFQGGFRSAEYGEAIDAEMVDDLASDWLRISNAVRELHIDLKTRLAGEEPAPWIDPPVDPFDAERENATLRHRRTSRTSLTLRRALLSGDLTAYLVRGEESHPLPAWTWGNGSAAENAFHFNWLPLNPLLEHGLHGFGDWRCFVSRAEFKKWLARPDIAQIGDLPILPAPSDHDARPDENFYREPPERQFVELTQALTWIAFGISLNGKEFGFMESCGFGPFAKDDWPDGFRSAMASFADQASAGNIRVRGRYVANYSDHTAAAQADTVYLTDTQLRDFARFDSLHGGLERGAGLVWGEEPLEHILNGKHDGWQDVEVCRADLMNLFNNQSDAMRALTQPIPASLPDIGAVMGLDEALSWFAYNRPSYDCQLWQNDAGEVELRDPSGNAIEPAVDGSLPQRIEAFRQASRNVHGALRDGELASYVALEDSSPLQVPRVYWNWVNPESLHLIYRGMSPEDQGKECVILVSRTAFDEWRNGGLHASGAESDAKARAPAVKKGRPPSQKKILAKADEMKARGLDGRTLASMMRHEPGFENVATTEVRELIKGRYKPGGRPSRKGA